MASRQSWMRQTPLYGVRVPGDGPLPARVMLIGERPGKTEPATGRPFTGASGHELDRYLKLAGLSRSEVYVTNLVKDYLDCDPTEEEVARDTPELLQEIEDCDPSIIIPLGRFASRYFLGDVDMERVHGLAYWGDQFGWPGRYLYPCYHPAAGLHSGDTVPIIHSDFCGLLDIGERLFPSDGLEGKERYGVRGGRGFLLPDAYLAVDSEGYRHDPWSIQVSQAAGEGRIAYRGDQIQQFAGDWNRFWSAGGRLLFHNSLHDLQVVEALGLSVRDGQYTDTMILSYILRDLPQSLKLLAYRICGMEMMEYGEVTASARERLEQEWLAIALAIADDIAPPELELLWDDKKGHWRAKKPYTIAQRLNRMVTDLAKGPVDIAARVSNWTDTAAEELEEVAGPVPTPTLADIPRPVADHYACRDADATFRIAPYLIRRVDNEGLRRVAEIDHAILPIVNQMQVNGILIDPDHFRKLDEEWTAEMEVVRDQIEELGLPRINPSSPDQVAALLFKQLGLPSKKLTKGGDDSTNDKVLESLRDAHPVLPFIMDYRELSKMRGSFCRKMLRLVSPDGRVRGNIRVTRTESGRMSMTEPNLMAIPVRMKRGLRVREGFIAREGCVIGNWDLDQIEMREIADVSRDEFLIELLQDPSRDIHIETAARMFSKPVGSIDPKTERYAAKRVGFGIATQITGRGLVDQMDLAGALHADGRRWTENECDSLIELWYSVYPGVRRFIDRTKAEIRREGVVRDRYGRIRHLEAVWSTVERIREEALRQAPSHKIQAGAQGTMKRNMAAIWADIKDLVPMGVWPLLQIHDSLMLEYPEDLHPLVNEIVMEGMEKTCQDDYCVPITASGERGYNWGEMNHGG